MIHVQKNAESLQKSLAEVRSQLQSKHTEIEQLHRTIRALEKEEHLLDKAFRDLIERGDGPQQIDAIGQCVPTPGYLKGY
jgi:cell division protein FtsL